jgi:hypothetical protein
VVRAKCGGPEKNVDDDASVPTISGRVEWARSGADTSRQVQL